MVTAARITAEIPINRATLALILVLIALWAIAVVTAAAVAIQHDLAGHLAL